MVDLEHCVQRSYFELRWVNVNLGIVHRMHHSIGVHLFGIAYDAVAGCQVITIDHD